MAPNLRRNLTLLLVAGWATTVLAATAADIKKFPPIAGEIFGQAAAGVRSITVNGKPVTFDGAQNFRANVKLRAGEKYLTLRINYEGLRIIKKYLILRKSAVTKFKVFVPKEKLEKELRAIKPSAAELLRQKRAKLLAAREKAEAARLFAEEERLKTEAKWVKQVSSPRFFANEFGSTSPEGLAQAIARDIQFMGKAKGSSLEVAIFILITLISAETLEDWRYWTKGPGSDLDLRTGFFDERALRYPVVAPKLVKTI